MKRNIKLTIEYDGTEFVGWQRQPNGRTVQDELEKGLKRLFQQAVTVVGAGRTDSGVHARGQVANFIASHNFTPDEVHKALNGILPDDIVIISVEEVHESFSARFSAKEREYRYYISRRQSAINRKYSWSVGYNLDVEAMNRAAQMMMGTHDFQSMAKSDSVVEHHLCMVIESKWIGDDSQLIYQIRANRFLQGMVRALVGTMVDVGRGHTNVDTIPVILESKNRSKAGQSAPAHGLFLERVTY